jgi:hypothetical protein
VSTRTDVAALTGALRAEVPACCRDCVFWQSLTGTVDRGRKDRWIRTFEDEHGAWGRAIFEADTFAGLIQYGPSAAFPRARTLPTGPPAPGSMLLTCVFLTEHDTIGSLERLLLEALADAKARSFTTVDAFAIDSEGDGPTVGHHTLFHRTTLDRMGFAQVRARGPVRLMRLELRGLQEPDVAWTAPVTLPQTLPAAS